jgi:hypothetical protein
VLNSKLFPHKVDSVHSGHSGFCAFDVLEVDEGVSSFHYHFSNITELFEGKSQIVSGDSASNSTDVDLGLESGAFISSW